MISINDGVKLYRMLLADKIPPEAALAILELMDVALKKLPGKNFFSSTVENKAISGEPAMFICHHPIIDANEVLTIWQSDTASPIDKGPCWRRAGGVCDFDVWDSYWPLSLSQFMVPWIVEGVARHHLKRVTDIVAGELVGSSSMESLTIQFQLWHSLMQKLAISAKGVEGEDNAQAAENQLHLHVTAFREWDRLDVGSELDGVAASNFASTNRMFEDVGFR